MMADENTMNNTNDTPTAVPPAPNGHRTSNATPTGEMPQADTAKDNAAKGAPSSNRKKKKKRHQHDKTSASASAPVESATVETADQAAPKPDKPVGPAEPVEPAEPTEPIEPQSPTEEIAAAPIDESAAAPTEQRAATPIEQPAESLRLRMKAWTDRTTGKRYLMPSAFMRDIVNGQPMSDVMYAYAMRDDDTKLVTLTAGEWNELPFFYFQEDGPAPRATARPVDVVVSTKGAS